MMTRLTRHSIRPLADSSDPDEVLVRQWSAGKLCELAAEREWTKVDTGESEAIDQRSNLRLRGAIIAGVEQHATTTVCPWIACQYVRPQMIECLHQARPTHQLGDHLA